MNLESIVAECREWFADPDFSRLRGHLAATGEHAVGLFPVYTPEEIVLAAGFLPVHTYGGGNLVEIDHADSRIQSFVCSICRSTLELGLTARLDWAEGFVFPSICDVARNLSGVWTRNFPDRFAAYIHFPEKDSIPAARQYLRTEFARLEHILERRSGRSIRREDYHRAFAVLNEQRKLLRQLYTLRSEQPWKLTTLELYTLTRAGGMMPREQHIEMLRLALAEAGARVGKPQDRIRVVVEGSFCEQPPLDLLMAIEDAGCYIVDDDFLLGQRYLEQDVPLAGDPLDALAETFLEAGVPTATYRSRRPRGPALVEKARAARADGVIFCIAKFCEPALYDYVLLNRELEKAGIPALYFEFEEKANVFDNMRMQVESFVESRLLFS
ncbi:MAG: 2-hydroxyacyl-CoA dehydratase [Acidobacteria bacterium]|nr:2-hydroxyacyl-CoA dehydratase [Acidobacteriota bacterium]